MIDVPVDPADLRALDLLQRKPPSQREFARAFEPIRAAKAAPGVAW